MNDGAKTEPKRRATTVLQKRGKKGRFATHVPNEQSRTLARLAKALAWSNERIAAVLGISRPTLDKHYGDDMTRGTDEMLLKVFARLVHTATQSSDARRRLPPASSSRRRSSGSPIATEQRAWPIRLTVTVDAGNER